MVRPRSAKPLFVGSIPTHASNEQFIIGRIRSIGPIGLTKRQSQNNLKSQNSNLKNTNLNQNAKIKSQNESSKCKIKLNPKF